VLEQEWATNQNFETDRIRAIANRLGIPHRHVYKWVWDK
jgi:hypothetical protein